MEDLYCIWKHPISSAEFNAIKMPRNAKVLCVAQEGDHPALGFLWEMHPKDQEQNLVERHFEIVGTGSVFDVDNTYYIGTYQKKGFVWHVFELVGDRR
jgi:hypothetical protein